MANDPASPEKPSPNDDDPDRVDEDAGHDRREACHRGHDGPHRRGEAAPHLVQEDGGDDPGRDAPDDREAHLLEGADDRHALGPRTRQGSRGPTPFRSLIEQVNAQTAPSPFGRGTRASARAGSQGRGCLWRRRQRAAGRSPPDARAAGRSRSSRWRGTATTEQTTKPNAPDRAVNWSKRSHTAAIAEAAQPSRTHTSSARMSRGLLRRGAGGRSGWRCSGGRRSSVRVPLMRFPVGPSQLHRRSAARPVHDEGGGPCSRSA